MYTWNKGLQLQYIENDFSSFSCTLDTLIHIFLCININRDGWYIHTYVHIHTLRVARFNKMHTHGILSRDWINCQSFHNDPSNSFYTLPAESYRFIMRCILFIRVQWGLFILSCREYLNISTSMLNSHYYFANYSEQCGIKSARLARETHFLLEDILERSILKFKKKSLPTGEIAIALAGNPASLLRAM